MGLDETIRRWDGTTCPWCGWPLGSPNAIRCLHCGQAVVPETEQTLAVRPVRPVHALGEVPELPPVSLPPLHALTGGPDTSLSDVNTLRLPPRRGPSALATAALIAAVLIIIVAGTAGAVSLAQRLTPGGGPFGLGGGAPAAATATPRPTATPTSTPTPTPTPKPTATATPQPTLHTVFQDALTSNANGWPTGFNASIQSDGYHISSGYTAYVPLDAVPADVNITVDVEQLPSANDTYGIAFRVESKQQSHEYVFWINQSGQWGVYDGRSGRGGTLVRATSNDAIHKGTNVFNTIQVQLAGSHFVFFANGTQLGSVDSDTYDSGSVGLVNQGQSGTVVFKNLKITQWA